MKRVIWITMMFQLVASAAIGGGLDKDSLNYNDMYKGDCYLLDANKNRIKMETQRVSQRKKASAASYIPMAGYALGKTIIENQVKGLASGVRWKGEVKILIRGEKDIHPTRQFGLVKAEQNTRRKVRSVRVATSGNLFSNTTDEVEYVEFEHEKISEDIYLLKFKNIEPGEYVLITAIAGMEKTYRMFGVD
jgi:hypothetical protein